MKQVVRLRSLAAVVLLAVQLAPLSPNVGQAHAATGGTAAGLAQCGTSKALPGATVELYSGTSLLSTTKADGTTAQYSFDNVQPSRYTLRIQSGSQICGTAVDVVAGGVTTVPPPPAPTDPHNRAWTTAQTLNALASNGLPVTFDEYILSRDQSAWFKFQVGPESTVGVTLSGLAANYDLALYKDISKSMNALLAAQNLTQLTAEFAPDAYSPDAYSPDAYSPDAYSPDAYSPDAYSPDAYSPDAYSPDAYSPDAYSPEAPLASKLVSNGVLNGESVTSAAYAAAQTKSLIALSALDGTASEHIIRNTWANDGQFYVRVRGRKGAFNPAAPFHLEVIVQSGSCTELQPIVQASTTPVTSGGYKTLVLSDPQRLAPDQSSLKIMQQRLATFVARPEVHGIVVDLGDDKRVIETNAQADKYKTCPFAKNMVASAIKGTVDSYRSANPGLEYLVIIGNDQVIPFFRYGDETVLANERSYAPPLADGSASQAGLKLGYVLSDDGYGVNPKLFETATRIPLTDLAIGRLVERPDEIVSALDGYLTTINGVTPMTAPALVTGYDFMADAAQKIAQELAESTGKGVDTLIQPGGQSPTDSSAWTAEQLKTSLLTRRHDIVFLAGHFGAGSALAADFKTRLTTRDVEAASLDMTNMLVFSPGCHSGYNVVNDDEVAGLTPTFDWAEVAARKRFTLVGGTGYQYGETDFIEYSERMYLELGRQLRTGTGPVSIGKALVGAKKAYLANTPQLRGIHAKVLMETTLFGFPQLSVNMPGLPLKADATMSSVGGVTPYTTVPGLKLGLTRADLNVDTALAGPLNGAGSALGTYFKGSQGIVANPAEPVLPLEMRNVSVPGTVLRGVGLRGATYTEETNLRPLTGGAATELHSKRTPFVSAVPFPVRPWDVNYLDAIGGGATRLAVTPAQYVSTEPGAETGTFRKFGQMNFRLFYSNNLAKYGDNTPSQSAAPTIGRVNAVPETDAHGVAQLRYTVEVTGDPAAGIQETWVTYTATTGAWAGKWQTLDLAQRAGDASSLWTGSVALAGHAPGDVRFMVQAVNGVGLVSLATNQGSYYVPQTSSSTQPTVKQVTTLGFQALPTSGAFQETVTLQAKLTSAGQPLAGRSVAFSLGAHRRTAVTGTTGLASATLPIVQSPGMTDVRVAFEETTDLLPASATSPFTVTSQPTTLVLTPESGAVVATLTYGSSHALPQQTVVFAVSGGGKSYLAPVVTDYAGRARLAGTPLPAGSYTVKASYGGTVGLANGSVVSLPNAGYATAQATGSFNLTP